MLQTALQNVEEAAEMDSTLSGALDALKGVIDTVEETARTLRRYREGLEADPQALNELEARLAQLATIKRKYGPARSMLFPEETVLPKKLNALIMPALIKKVCARNCKSWTKSSTRWLANYR